MFALRWLQWLCTTFVIFFINYLAVTEEQNGNLDYVNLWQFDWLPFHRRAVALCEWRPAK